MAASTDYSSKPLSVCVVDLCLLFFFQFVASTTTRLKAFYGDREDS